MRTKNVVFDDGLAAYIHAMSDREHPVLAKLRKMTAEMPMAGMQISPMQGQFMQMLLQATAARTVLEVGVFTGYSSLAMALALPADGRIVALDVSEEWTSIARKHWQMAGVADKIELRLAPAVGSLEALLEDGRAGSFDAAFIDADKENYCRYWDLCLELIRPGGLVMVDNTLFSGLVTPAWHDDALRARWSDLPAERIQARLDSVDGIRAFNLKARDDDRVTLSLVPLGDGLTFGVKH